MKPGFNLATDLLIRASLDQQLLTITAHHLVVDGISWRILLEDLYTAYRCLEQQQPVKLPMKTASLARWQHALQEMTIPDKELNYWKHAEALSFSIPADVQTADWRVLHARTITGSLDGQRTSFLLRDAHRNYNTDVPILLNCALALTLQEWTGRSEIIVEQENHGRHLDGINVSRTTGWFTALYPQQLSIPAGSPGEQIMAIKEQLRKLPGQGLGYGSWKLSQQGWKPGLPAVRFNYLGQFDQEADNELFSLQQEEMAIDSSPRNRLTSMLELNSMVAGGKFLLTITYNQLAHSRETMQQFRDSYFTFLQAILEYLQGAEDIQFTPSDFDVEELNSEDLKQLFG